MNQQQPDVSVIVLTYNVQWEKLKPTLESILMQEDVNCEIVMADDGSLCGMTNGSANCAMHAGLPGWCFPIVRAMAVPVKTCTKR